MMSFCIWPHRWLLWATSSARSATWCRPLCLLAGWGKGKPSYGVNWHSGSSWVRFLPVLLEDKFASLFHSTFAVGLALMITGLLLLCAEWVADRARQVRQMADLGVLDVLLIGMLQALAIIPGISRSGATISGGMLLGLERGQAARFSFLLSIPVILGAGLVKVGDLAEGFSAGMGVYVAGTLAAFLSGLLAVHFLLRLVRTRSLRPFSFYVLVLGFFVVVLSVL